MMDSSSAGEIRNTATSHIVAFSSWADREPLNLEFSSRTTQLVISLQLSKPVIVIEDHRDVPAWRVFAAGQGHHVIATKHVLGHKRETAVKEQNESAEVSRHS